MVLTSPRKALATLAVSSGGCSGSGEVVSVILLASREKEKAHELLGKERNWKQPLVRHVSHWNSAATERAPRRGFLPELGEKKKCRRLGGLEGMLGSALSSQWCGESGGMLNLTGDGTSAVNLREWAVGVLRFWTGKSCSAVRAGAQGEGEASPGRPRSPVTQEGRQL